MRREPRTKREHELTAALASACGMLLACITVLEEKGVRQLGIDAMRIDLEELQRIGAFSEEPTP